MSVTFRVGLLPYWSQDVQEDVGVVRLLAEDVPVLPPVLETVEINDTDTLAKTFTTGIWYFPSNTHKDIQVRKRSF